MLFYEHYIGDPFVIVNDNVFPEIILHLCNNRNSPLWLKAEVDNQMIFFDVLLT